MSPWYWLGVLAVAAIGAGAIRRPKWDDATALHRLRAGTMTEAEKMHRGYYPYHGGALL